MTDLGLIAYTHIYHIRHKAFCAALWRMFFIRENATECIKFTIIVWGNFVGLLGGLFDELGVGYVVEPGVEESDLGNYGQSEE